MAKQRMGQLEAGKTPILWDVSIFSAAMAALLALPMVGYTFNEVIYTLPGFYFLTGTTISGGTVQVAPSVLVWLIVVCAAAGLVLGLLAPKLGRRIAGLGCTLSAVVAAVAVILFSMGVELTLSLAGAKRVGVQYSYLAVLAVAVVLLGRGLHLLGKAGMLKGRFELVALPAAIILSLAVPFASYTYKRVSHPYTGFDMLTQKEVAEGAVTGISGLPIAILVCCVAMMLLGILADMGRRRNIGAILLLSAAVIVLVVIGSVTVTGMLEQAKDPTANLLSMIPALFAVAIFARGLALLQKAKVLSALDFMLVPGLIYLLINNYIPMVGILLAFKKIDYTVGIFESPWCGFDNFRYLFSSRTAWIITRNTVLYNLAFIVIGIFTGMLVGICLFAVTKKAVQTFFQTSILLPQLISMIVVAYIVYAFLSNEAGFINISILGGTDVNFYGETKLWPFLLVFVNNWKQIGYNSIIFLSSIVGIDRGLYEAAQVDGCSPWQQITKITIPQLKPTIITLTLLQVGRVFYSDFGLFYQVPLDSGALYNVTNTIDTYVYRSLMVLNNISSASAASAFQAVCGFVLVFTVNLIVRKLDRDNALF